MLKPEVAQAQVKEWTIEDSSEVLKAKIDKLPAKLKLIGYALAHLDADGQNYSYQRYQEFWKFHAEQKQVFGKLSKADRTKLFKQLYGTLAPAVELTLEHLKNQPYQDSYWRRAFRAPNNEAVTLDLRFSWLNSILGIPTSYEVESMTPSWLAAWCPYLSYGNLANECGKMFSAVIDAGGKEGEAVFQTLVESATNEHEIGSMGRHVSRGLLGSAREDGWELMEKMLLAAQRQEGLRQVLLETVDESHPEAFRRMLRIIVDQKLARFSAVARAIDVWLGMQWDSASVKTINTTCENILQLLESDAQRKQALKSNDPEQVFYALWATAFDDVEVSIPVAAKLTTHKEATHRFVAAYHLSQTSLDEANEPFIKLLDDENPRVALLALQNVHGIQDRPKETKASRKKREEALFASLERLFNRLPPKPQKIKELVWPWTAGETSRSEVAARMVNCIGDLPPSRLIPYIQEFDPRNRHSACEYLSQQKKWSNETRECLISLMGDASPDVRKSAMSAFRKKPIQTDEAERIEGYLTRKASDLRQGIVRILLSQKDPEALVSSQRLMAAKNANQRYAGLELLKEMAEADRQREKCLSLTRDFQENQKRLTKDEETQIQAILETGKEKLTIDNGLGLYDPAERTPRITPKKRKVKAITPATVKILQALDDLVHEHRDVPVKISNWSGETEEPLGGIRYGFSYPDWHIPAKDQLDKLPLSEIWLKWEENRPKALRDPDEAEFLRASYLLDMASEWRWEGIEKWLKKRPELYDFLVGKAKFPELRYRSVVDGVLSWLVRLKTPASANDLSKDVSETIFALIPDEDNQALTKLSAGPQGRYYYRDMDEQPDWREIDFYNHWLTGLGHLDDAKNIVTQQHFIRRWELKHWLDEPVDGACRRRPELSDICAGYNSKAANLVDLMDQMIGRGSFDFSSLKELTAPRPSSEVSRFLAAKPEVAEAVDRIRERVLEIELARADLPTAATGAASAIQSFEGIPTLVRGLTALGKERYKQAAYYWRETGGKAESLTGIIKSCYPAPDETGEDFTRQMKEALKQGAFPEDKIMQLAFLAPQWTQHVRDYYGWEGLDEGLYWFLAHMRYVSGGEEAAIAAGVEEEPADDFKDEDQETVQSTPKLSAWARLVMERTPLTDEERNRGVVDVSWFHRTFALLGRKKWEALAEASRFASSSGQAKRAKFIADVLLGNVKKTELVKAIRERKLKDQVRLLGLLPMAKGARAEKDLQDRYKVLQEYKRYAKTLSSLSRPDAEQAAEIGMQNLAQLAGYEDPMRLEWAMEAKATQDLLEGPIVVSKGDVSLTLSLDDRSQPQLTIDRAGKTLKTLPKPLKAEKRFAELTERNRELKRQASRVRGSLETAMCRGDVFTGTELANIANHALLKPMLERLVLVGEGIVGYPDKNGKVLRSHDGKCEPIKKNEKLRIAHPWDLLETKEWDKWQHDCFQAERLQPFKQIFRELYVVTAQEKTDKSKSNRYAGQQVNPQQAFALWGQRGWKVDEGVFKTFHREGLTVFVEFEYGVGSPLDVEGLTLDTIQFADRDHNILPLEEIPERIFSEVMRDLDLVVSVAHRGGVDPEASASTVEMRAALLSETCKLLGIKNIKFNKSHVTINGFLSDYSIHLGSGVVHRLPGGAVCIVPVHAQHRGRLFLPFADDDPKTAEVISKTLLLAKDKEIQDPTILEQLQAAVS